MSTQGRLFAPRLGLCLLGVLGLAALGACKPEPEPVPPAPAVPAAQPAPLAEAVAGQPQRDGIQARVGRYSDGQSTLELSADGRYLQTLQATGAAISAGGQWRLAAPGSIVLIPDGVAGTPVRFEAVSADELRAEDGSRSFRRLSAGE